MGSHPHHSNKKDLGKYQSLFYGALNGLISEPQQPDIFSIIDTEECQFLYGRIEKLLAA